MCGPASWGKWTSNTGRTNPKAGLSQLHSFSQKWKIRALKQNEWVDVEHLTKGHVVRMKMALLVYMQPGHRQKKQREEPFETLGEAQSVTSIQRKAGYIIRGPEQNENVEPFVQKQGGNAIKGTKI